MSTSAIAGCDSQNPEKWSSARSAPTIHIDEAITIDNARLWHANLRDALTGPGDLMIDLSKVAHLDYFGTQLLIAATKTAHSQGKKLMILNGGPVLAAAATAAGWTLEPEAALSLS
jgi:anti-anti-sigma regulatory factor